MRFFLIKNVSKQRIKTKILKNYLLNEIKVIVVCSISID